MESVASGSQLRLIRLTAAHERAFREMAAEYAAAGEDLHQPAAANFAGYLELCAEAEQGIVPAGFVPWTSYWLADARGGLIGGIRLRHELTERLWQDGGHIGYDIRPSLRNRGYATRMLALCLDKARERGLAWVLLTVAPDNVASIRVMEKNGARRIGTADESGYYQYRIDL